MNTPIRVLIVDDHPIVCDGMAAILGCTEDIKVVGEAAGDERLAKNFSHFAGCHYDGSINARYGRCRRY
jgi:DNA-binding NarL/FixJ family response regulator